jgi:hypothetical protein
MPKTIGFIGLGIMGKPMAKHLITPAILGGVQPHRQQGSGIGVHGSAPSQLTQRGGREF